MIEILKVVVKDFLGVEMSEVDLSCSGLTLVVGENGSGKSARYVEALVWGLFGETIREVSVDDVVREGGKTAEVEVSLRIDGVDWRVRRVKPRGSAARFHAEFLTSSGWSDPFPSAGVKEKQAVWERSLGIDLRTFVNSITFGQGAAGMFAGGLDDAGRKAIFDKVCGLEVYDEAFVAAKADRVAAESEVRVAQERVLGAVRDRERAREVLEAVEVRSRTFAENADVEKARLTSEIDRLVSADVRVSEEIAAAEKALAEVVSSGEVAPVPSMGEGVQILKEVRAESSRLSGELAVLRSRLSGMRDESARLEEASSRGVCPTCERPYDEHDESVDRRRGELFEGIREVERRIVDVRVEFDEVSALVVGAERLAAKEAEAVAVARAEERSRVELKRSRETALAALRGSRANGKAALSAVRSELAGWEDRVEKARRDVESARTAVSSAEEMCRVAEVANALRVQDLRVAEFWEAGFGPKGIRAYVVESVLPELNRLANEHLGALSDGELTVAISPTTALKKGGAAERLSVAVSNRGGSSVYGGNSGGERRRIDLALLLAFQDLVGLRVGSRINLAVYDEILDALDSSGQARAVNLLRERSKERPTFLISHSDDVRALIEDVVEVTV